MPIKFYSPTMLGFYHFSEKTNRSGIGIRRCEILYKWQKNMLEKSQSLMSILYGTAERAQPVNIRSSIFSFSRRSAQARVPVKLNSLGIFDTLAPVGMVHLLLVADGHMEWANTETALRVNPKMKKCLHLCGGRRYPSCSGQNNVLRSQYAYSIERIRHKVSA